jgi:hypothetical protein
MEAGRSYDFRACFVVGFRPRTECGAGLSRVRVPGMCFLPHRISFLLELLIIGNEES